VPSVPLLASTVYYVSVYGITDLVGQVASTFTSFTTGVGAETARPTVVAVSPAANAANVPVNARVSALLSEVVSPVTVGSMSIALAENGNSVAGSIALSGDRRSLTFTAAAALKANTSYTVFVGGFADIAGNLVVPFASAFTTGNEGTDVGPLLVSSFTPANGSTDVPVNTNVVVTFNKAVNAVTVNTGTIQVSYPGVGQAGGAFTANGATVTFTPATALPGNTTISLQVSGVQDLAGSTNNYATSAFHTAAVADTTPPTIVGVTPSDGATGVGLNTQVVVSFSESLNPATVNNNTFGLFANGSRFGYVSGVSADNRTVMLSGGTLPAASLITLAVTSGVQDLAGNALADFTSSFTSGEAPDITRPSVVSQRPGNGASGAAATTGIVLFLSKPMNAATVTDALHVSQNGTLVDGTVQVTGNGQAIQFRPTSPWASSALIQVFLEATAQDMKGNGVNPYQGSFRTASDPATTAPAVTAVSPSYGASNVALNPVIAIGYNEPLDPTTVNASTVTLSGPSGAVNVSLSLDGTGTVILMEPVDASNNRMDLQPNAFYAYQTTAGIRGRNGVAQANGGYWYFYTGTTRDTTAPTVLAVTPPAGSTGVGDNARIVVRFSEPVNPLTVNGTTIAVTGTSAVAASMSFANQNRDVFLEPYVPLPDGQTLTVTIAGVTDVSGNAVAATTTQFAVGTGPDVFGPTVLAENPANGLTNVPTNVVVSLQTNEPIDPSTVTSATFPVYDNVAGQVSGTYTVSSDGRTISFAPASPLAINRGHNVYIAYQGMMDLAGNLFIGYGLSNFGFTTGSSADTSGPQVAGISPKDQLTHVPRNAQVMIDFDRPINTLTASGITLTAGGQAVSVATTFTSGDTRVILVPRAPLAASTSCTVTVGAVTDLSGIPLGSAVVSQFTTAAGFDLVAPAVTSVSPANGALNVATSTLVQIGFSERMNPLTINRSNLVVTEQSTGAPVAGDVVVSADGMAAVFIPSSALAASVGYYVQGSGWTDLVGQPTSVFTSFRTGP
jgi:hypothetical protein